MRNNNNIFDFRKKLTLNLILERKWYELNVFVYTNLQEIEIK